MNHPLPKITIITPSFNQANYLEQTIQSVVNQGYPDLEYIIVDGGSTDGSVEIIKKHEKHLAYWVSEKDCGQSDAINKGLKRTTGTIINWINSDDYYEPGALLKIAESFKDENVNIVSGRGRIFREDETLSYTKGVDIYEGNLAKTIGWLRMDQPETFYRAEVIKKMGPLDTRLHYLMDRNWWFRYLLLYGSSGICKMQDVLVNFRIHPLSKTSSRKEDFETEHNSFFFYLAQEYGLKEFATAIRDSGKILNGWSEQVKAGMDQSLIKRIFSYYFLLRGNICYEMDQKKAAGLFYSYVDEKDLEPKDRTLFQTMKFRNKLPVHLINLLRKFTR